MSEVVARVGRSWVAAPQQGVEICVLHSKGDSREVAALIRMAEGARLPWHGHPGGEHTYVLEGRARVGKELLEAGDYHHTRAGEEHEVAAAEPCLLLSVLPKERPL